MRTVSGIRLAFRIVVFSYLPLLAMGIIYAIRTGEQRISIAFLTVGLVGAIVFLLILPLCRGLGNRSHTSKRF